MAGGHRGDLLGRALGDDQATAGAALGAHVHEPVGGLDHVEVVLDDDDRVALVDQAGEDLQQLADVLEVQTGGRLVEDVDRAAGGALLELARELHALRLTAGQSGRGLAEPDVAETDVVQRLQVAIDRRDRLEEVHRLFDRHVQDLGDGLALVVDLQGLPVVPGAVADLARDVHVREEVHLDLDGAVARAVLAAAALDVEGEAAGLVAADLRLGGLGEQPADVVEDTGVRRRVRARGAADGRLVDVHDLVDEVVAVHARVPPRDVPGAVELAGQVRVQDVVDQRRLAGAGHARDGREHSQRERDVDVLEVVLPGTVHREQPGRVVRAPDVGHRDRLLAGQVQAGLRLGVGEQLLQGAAVHDLAAVLTCAGADVDDPVGGLDGVLVVLDDDECVAHVAQPDEGLDQPVVVALMQTDGRLVEDVQHAYESGADLGGQADALGLAAGERAGRAVQREVVQADVDQEPQSFVDLLQHALGDLLVAGVELQLAQELRAVADRHRGDLGDRLLHDRDREDDRLQARALTGGAGHLAHVALEALTAGVALGLAVPPLDEGDGPFEGRRVDALAAVPVAVPDLDLRLVAIEQGLLGTLRQAREGDVGAEAERVREGTDQTAEVVLGVAVRPGVDGALVEGLVLVRDDQLRVDLHARADAGALGAGAERRVEGEGARLQLLEGEVVVRAVQVLRVHALTLGVVLGQVDEVEHDHAAGQPEGGLHGVGEPALGGVLHREAVDDHLDGVLLLLLQRGRVGQLDRLAVHPRAGVALGL